MPANLLRVPQDYAVSFGAANAKQTFQALGEEFIVLNMFHVNTDADTQPRCGVCYNDVYMANEDPNCPYCYGTTFVDGVKEAWRAWGVVADQSEDETFSKTGVWQNETHDVQMEAYPPINQNDYIARVRRWDIRHQAPLEIGSFYKVGAVSPITVRTGARYGGTNVDRIAKKFNMTLLPVTNVIYKFDIPTGVAFGRHDNEPR